MSIFSKFRNAKKAAEKHKNAQAAKDTEPKAIAPYRHVPTHAAIDALSGAPSAWQHEDRAAIQFQNNKRRSQMIRNDSTLSTATSHNTAINRNSSFNSSDTYGTREIRLEMRRSHMGHQGYDHYTDNPGYRSSRHMAKSPLASTQISPIETASNSSSSSSQVLELANSTNTPYIQEPAPEPTQAYPRYVHQPQAHRTHYLQDSTATQTQYLEEPNVFDSIHKGRKRKVGEAPLWDHVPERPKVFPVIAETAIDTKPAKRRSGFGLLGKRSSAIAAH
ncbi:hypothetical protein MMC13_002598 [Lambiella insularis]|nr:hypothetical protein [Lambiella insularis]